MLFSRNKDQRDKSGPFLFDDTAESIEGYDPSAEEETMRRWRDLAASRSQKNAQMGNIGMRNMNMFEENDENINFTSPNAVAPSWPVNNAPMNNPNEAYYYMDEPQAPEDEYEFQNSGLKIKNSDTSAQKTIELQVVEQENSHALEQQTTASAFAAQPTIQRTQPQTIQELNKNKETMSGDLSLPIGEDLQRRFGEIRSALGPGTVIEGTFKFDSPVCVDGTLTGEITSTSALIVGQEATINGNINVGSLIILGTVQGIVKASDLIEIRAGGRLDADISTKRIAIEDGGWYSGNISMKK
jgi:cytoskeletal protein CcmA (bactofilin family)